MSLAEVLKKTFNDESFIDLSVEKRLDSLVPKPESKAYELADKILTDFYSIESDEFPKEPIMRQNFKDRRAHMAIKFALNTEQSDAFVYLCPDVKPIVTELVLIAPATEPRLRMTVSLAIIFAFYHRFADQISSDIYKRSKVYSED